MKINLISYAKLAGVVCDSDTQRAGQEMLGGTLSQAFCI